MIGQGEVMPNYIRPVLPVARVFFTVCLARRGWDLLVHEVARLRAAVRVVRRERQFAVEAWVVLPDHMHAVLRMPEGVRPDPGRAGGKTVRGTVLRAARIIRGGGSLSDETQLLRLAARIILGSGAR